MHALWGTATPKLLTRRAGHNCQIPFLFGVNKNLSAYITPPIYTISITRSSRGARLRV